VTKEMKLANSAELDDRSLVVTRTFDAPRDLVFDAFTDPKRIANWWGPRGCTVVSCDMDLRIGGAWAIAMRSRRTMGNFKTRYGGSGDSEWIVERQRGEYREIVRPERLVFTYTFLDEAGQPIHETLVTITLSEERGKTTLMLHQASFESSSVCNDHIIGWNEALDRMIESLGTRH